MEVVAPLDILEIHFLVTVLLFHLLLRLHHHHHRLPALLLLLRLLGLDPLPDGLFVLLALADVGGSAGSSDGVGGGNTGDIEVLEFFVLVLISIVCVVVFQLVGFLLGLLCSQGSVVLCDCWDKRALMGVERERETEKKEG